MAFYTTDTFHDSPAAAPPGSGAFVLTEDQINQIAAFLRALNALENIRSSNAYDQRRVDSGGAGSAQAAGRARDGRDDRRDRGSHEGPVRLFAGTLAVQLLQEARELERQALRQDPPNTELLQRRHRA